MLGQPPDAPLGGAVGIGEGFVRHALVAFQLRSITTVKRRAIWLLRPLEDAVGIYRAIEVLGSRSSFGRWRWRIRPGSGWHPSQGRRAPAVALRKEFGVGSWEALVVGGVQGCIEKNHGAWNAALPGVRRTTSRYSAAAAAAGAGRAAGIRQAQGLQAGFAAGAGGAQQGQRSRRASPAARARLSAGGLKFHQPNYAPSCWPLSPS